MIIHLILGKIETKNYSLRMNITKEGLYLEIIRNEKLYNQEDISLPEKDEELQDSIDNGRRSYEIDRWYWQGKEHIQT